MKNIFILLIFLIIVFLYLKTNKIDFKIFKKNMKMLKFKKNLLSKESFIKKIYLRNDERITLNPNINIQIDFYEKEYEIVNKTNIHRARLAKFKKSKFNGEFIFIDENENVYKVVNGIKKYL